MHVGNENLISLQILSSSLFILLAHANILHVGLRLLNSSVHQAQNILMNLARNAEDYPCDFGFDPSLKNS